MIDAQALARLDAAGFLMTVGAPDNLRDLATRRLWRMAVDAGVTNPPRPDFQRLAGAAGCSPMHANAFLLGHQMRIEPAIQILDWLESWDEAKGHSKRGPNVLE